MARQGKIARLPAVLRKEVNRRLFDGQGAPQILPWLNLQPDAIAVWEELFEGAACTPQNLSEWMKGGYKDWRKQQDYLENLKDLSNFSRGLVQAADGKLADGLAAMASGEIMSALETVGNILVTGGSDDAERDPLDGLAKITGAIKQLQDGERKLEDSRRKEETLQLNKDRHSLSKRQVRLAEEKFQKQTVEMLMEFARKPEVQALLGGRESKTVQMDKLHQIVFGEAPKKEVA